MNFKRDDRVKYSGKNQTFRMQSGDGEGTIIGASLIIKGWFRVRWDNGIVHGYPGEDLRTVHTEMSGADEYDEVLACQEAMESL